ncbi:hypothetical protein NT01CX_0596 [Clostridium novyi NT]|uniref:Uncharacterized protein n=1 Tax=Clostridium novyi (strain NT) TaxID=386415 RepID=A0Q360_CLONN|nr:hypothetical protein NT01CX_0596 [Clostridium novyi NT]
MLQFIFSIPFYKNGEDIIVDMMAGQKDLVF